MLELDDLLTGYLEQQYEAAGKAEKDAFHALLELPDPELMGYLLNLKQPASEPIGNVVKHILDRDISA
jgi:succinate dehydrogenase flavin-adding protein (antitoxin of CptAB toxin-antitoxin module)